MIAYVAGPYRADGWEAIETNIEQARTVAVRLWQLGYAVICPHLNTAHFDGVVPDKRFLDGDLEIIGRCDLVALTARWAESFGARAEREFALKIGIPVYELDDVPAALPGAGSKSLEATPASGPSARVLPGAGRSGAAAGETAKNDNLGAADTARGVPVAGQPKSLKVANGRTMQPASAHLPQATTGPQGLPSTDASGSITNPEANQTEPSLAPGTEAGPARKEER